MTFAQTVSSVEELKERVIGRVLTPGDSGYEQARQAWDLNFTHRPAVIVIAQNAADIVAAVQFARDTGLGVAVQSTGHGMQFPADDNLLIVTSQMTAVDVDVQARVARVEAGALWKHVLDEATPHGLAPLVGSSPYVGVVGYMLGGGIGWLSRRYGLAADSVGSIDIVTPDGVLRHASPSENSELFWGLRGGGGNFGVVTAIEYELYPVASIYGGSLVYPGELAGDVLRFFRDWVKTLPDEMTSSMGIMKFPDLPAVPEPMRGKTQVMLHAAYSGNPAEGAALIQQWLAWRTPINNSFHEMLFSEIGTISNDPVEPMAGYGSNEMLDELNDQVIDVILLHVMDADSPLGITELRHAGGAIKRADPDANAVGNRDAEFYLQMAGLTDTPEAYKAVKAAIPPYKEALRPYVRGGVYLNFMKGDESLYRVKDAYLPESFERLIALKAKYDPDNLFRYSYQIVPA